MKYQKSRFYIFIIIIFLTTKLQSQENDTTYKNIDYCEIIKNLKSLLSDSTDDYYPVYGKDSLGLFLLEKNSNINPSYRIGSIAWDFYYPSVNSGKSLFKDDIKLYSLYYGCEIELKPDSGDYNYVYWGGGLNRNCGIRINKFYDDSFFVASHTFNSFFSYKNFTMNEIFRYGKESVDMEKFNQFRSLEDSLLNCLLENPDSIPKMLTDGSLDRLKGYYFFNDSGFITDIKVNMRAELVNTINSVFLLMNLYNNNCGCFKVPKEEYTYEEYLELPTCTLLLIRARNLLRYGY